MPVDTALRRVHPTPTKVEYVIKSSIQQIFQLLFIDFVFSDVITTKLNYYELNKIYSSTFIKYNERYNDVYLNRTNTVSNQSTINVSLPPSTPLPPVLKRAAFNLSISTACASRPNSLYYYLCAKQQSNSQSNKDNPIYSVC